MNLSYAFVVGMVATVNPCGFVLLPAYLTYFLGTQGPLGDRPAPVVRALVVSLVLSAGFVATFLVVGAAAQVFVPVLSFARFLTLVAAAGFIVLGIAMLSGAKLPIPTLSVKAGGDRSLRTMFTFGVAYSAASISCSLPLFSTVVVFGAVRRGGFLAGVGNAIAYGVGMALVVSVLTISVALARPGLLGGLRLGMKHLHVVTGVLMTTSGVYLAWYFWSVDLNGQSDPLTSAVERMQLWAQNGLEQHWRFVAGIAVVAVGLVIVVAVMSRRRSGGTASAGQQDSPAPTDASGPTQLSR